MIIGSFEVWKVGDRNKGVSEADGTPHVDQPFVVTRIATAEEWTEEAIRDGMTKHQAVCNATCPGALFYEVSTD